jgi:hypothetical protein
MVSEIKSEKESERMRVRENGTTQMRMRGVTIWVRVSVE